MIRAIQIGTTTVQGRVSATYPDPTGEHGAILSNGRVVMGRLTDSKRRDRSDEECGKCRHWERHEPRDAGGFCARFNNGMAFEDEWCADFEIKEWMAGE